MNFLTSPIMKEEVHGIELNADHEPEATLILNFNYTNTIKIYHERFYRRSNKPVPIINFIHGQISDKLNPLVFGFGDELDDDYLKMEREKVKGYFAYIKSFWYLRKSNYRELIR